MLMRQVEERPSRVLRVSLASLTCTSDGFTCAIAIPANTREAFVTGAWDTTGMLLDRYEEVRLVAERLPYRTGFRSVRAG
jgi:hypothetical protein